MKFHLLLAFGACILVGTQNLFAEAFVPSSLASASRTEPMILSASAVELEEKVTTTTRTTTDGEGEPVAFPPPLSQLDRLKRAAVFWPLAVPTVANYYDLPQPVATLAMESTPKMLYSALSLRGGVGVALDMVTESHHLAVLSSYAVLTVLVLNSALRIYTSAKFKRDPSKKYDSFLPNLFFFFSGVCVITGIFTGIMFQLLGIYSRSALGMGNLAGYAAFKAATESFRRLGFQTFLTCLGSFVVIFLIHFRNMTNEGGRFGDKVFSLIAILALLGGVALKEALNLATVHVFAPMT